ncbi:MAG: prephenate dehydrogenase [Candidatus Hydrogenedentes bacterium]|nr:prephenate dehydrogenase [Candidatus Hydrogenedentota bacterium]
MGFISKQTLIIGVGLLGSSIGLALSKHKLAQRIVGIGRRVESLEIAKKMGAIEEYSLNFQDYARESDFIVICAPVKTSIKILQELYPLISPGTTITDVCSTKISICSVANSLWAQNCPFIGSHPIAGSEKFGPEYGRHDFYENSICFIEKKSNANKESQQKVFDFWSSLGAKVIEIYPDIHDLFLCYSSHLPHVLASTLATIVRRKGVSREFIGKGFIDTTRIAESRPELWTDISLTNKNNLIKSISEVIEQLEEFKKALENEDENIIYDFFRKGSDSRKQLLEK